MRILSVLMILPLAACASTRDMSAWRPQIDNRDVDTVQYEQDLTECRAYAEANPDADTEQAREDGMLAGGLLGGGAVAGSVAGTAAVVGTAAVAAVALPVALAVGGTALMMGRANGQQAEIRYQSIVNACLSGRGYRVIG